MMIKIELLQELLQMRYELELLAILACIMLLGGLIHFAYLNRIRAKLNKKVDSKVEMDDLKKALQVSQGSNFNTLLISSWSLYFVALVFLYFLTPTIFERLNYFQIADVASSDFGIIILGTAVILLSGMFAFSVPGIYRYYTIPRALKNIIIYLVPLLLLISISVSIYLSTIYPIEDNNSWNLGYLTLVVSQVLLLLPVFSGFVRDLH